MYAEIAINSPIAQRRSFSYHIPSELIIRIGQAVWVPFGNKTLQGIVLEINEYSAVEDTRDISGIINPQPLISQAQVYLARWLSNYYLSPLFDAVALMLPPGFQRKALTFISAHPNLSERDLMYLNEEQKQVLNLIRKQAKIGLKELESKFGKRRVQSIISHFIKHEIVIRNYELEPIKIKPKQEPFISLVTSFDDALKTIPSPRVATKQVALLDLLEKQRSPIPWSEIRQRLGINKVVVNNLISKGVIKQELVTIKRNPLASYFFNLSYPLSLSIAQQKALDSIKTSLRKGHGDAFLLHGITGSGKTEIYLQATAEAKKIGKRSIVLVPEISLTIQTIERFASRFPDEVTILHSGLSLGEQFDQWQCTKQGDFTVVVGPRSALFAPQPDLGLIIIDEEHEWTYKQHEHTPRYHTHLVAAKIAELTGSVVILGSATPCLESYYYAQQGRYQILELKERMTPKEGATLPQVDIVDMRQELKEGNRSIFSRALSSAVNQALANKEQVILYLNRRGGATFVQCRNCGYVMRCRRCEVPLTYHPVENQLICHQCNYRRGIPDKCPRCLSNRIKFLGTGTQKLAQEVMTYFPQARLLRWDSDTTKQRHSHQDILNRFRNQEANTLIGTQMIAKGFDLPSVTLVGVINADIALNLPDFRAGERTFQLLNQVAGRAGRGFRKGKVIIQTYSPQHYAIQAAIKQDYSLFYQQEIIYRSQLNYPPFTQLVNLIFSHINNDACQKEVNRLKKLIIEHRDAEGLTGISIIGPTPTFVQKLRGRYRWQLILRGHNLSVFLSKIPLPQGWLVDVDPINIT